MIFSCRTFKLCSRSRSSSYSWSWNFWIHNGHPYSHSLSSKWSPGSLAFYGDKLGISIISERWKSWCHLGNQGIGLPLTLIYYTACLYIHVFLSLQTLPSLKIPSINNLSFKLQQLPTHHPKSTNHKLYIPVRKKKKKKINIIWKTRWKLSQQESFVHT